VGARTVTAQARLARPSGLRGRWPRVARWQRGWRMRRRTFCSTVIQFAGVCGIDLLPEAYAKIGRSEARYPPPQGDEDVRRKPPEQGGGTAGRRDSPPGDAGVG
jgi:hypothetical protein